MHRSHRLIELFVVVAMTMAVVAGCAAGGSSLEGTKWRLTGWSANSLDPADFEITAQFADGKIGGKSGVNSYGGPYKAGPGDAFSVGDIGTTLMAGPEPAMRAETIYTALLTKSASYKVDGTALKLFDENGNESLIFEPAP